MKIIKKIIKGIPALVLIAIAAFLVTCCITMYTFYSTASDLGIETGKFFGVIVGTVKGDLEGTIEGKKDGQKAGETANDVEVDIFTYLKSKREIEYLRIEYTLYDEKFIPLSDPEYARLEKKDAEAVYSVDLSTAIFYQDGNTIRITVPTLPEPRIITDNSSVLVLDEYGDYKGDTKDILDTFLKNDIRVEEKAKKELSENKDIIEIVKRAAKNAIENVVNAVTNNKYTIIVNIGTVGEE